jgi:hypothetical protein
MLLIRPRGSFGRTCGIAVGLAVALSVLLSACAGSDYTYVSSASTRTYFKVPTRWKLFTKNQLLVAANLEDSPQAASSFPFLAGYDADPHPEIGHVLGGIPQVPVVMVQVQKLSASGHDQFSISSIRNAVYSVDQLLQQDAADILSYKEVVVSAGYHGLRMVYNLSLAGNLNVVEGNQVMRVNQVGLVDPATSLLYVLVIRCSAECYKHNQTAIDQVASSFTVRAH